MAVPSGSRKARFSRHANLATVLEYWHIETDTDEGGLLRRPGKRAPIESGTNAFVCSIEIDDFDAARDRILEKNGLVALPKLAVPGRRWQGYFIDTEGNTFGIFEVDERAG
jgi:uncharacterized protein